MKIAVTGGAGQLARVMRDHICENDKYFFLDRENLDITDREAVSKIINNIKPDIIINTAAYTDVDKAESEEDAAFLINSDAVGYLAECCSENNIILIHMSTDYVYGDNTSLPHKENDENNPETVYGRSKICGENLIKEKCEKYIIIRTSWLFSEYNKNFLKTIISILESKESIKVVNDQIGAPTSCNSLSLFIFKIVDSIKTLDSDALWGVYNFCNYPDVSWYNFAEKIVECIRIKNNKSYTVLPIPSHEYDAVARRPKNSKLNCSKYMSVFEINQACWIPEIEPLVDKLLGENNESY